MRKLTTVIDYVVAANLCASKSGLYYFVGGDMGLRGVWGGGVEARHVAG